MPKNRNPLVTLLAIDDDPQVLELISEALGEEEIELITASEPQAGLRIFFEKRPQIVITDLKMPNLNGLEVLEKIVDADPGAEVILMTADYSTDLAVEAIRNGACDFVIKPLDLKKLRERVKELMAHAALRRRTLELDHELLANYEVEGMIGKSPLMLDVIARLRRVAPHFRTVLLTGQTGTGKELAARALHRFSPAASKPFAVCNCSAIVDTLFESELFGYVRGAFTGANQDKIGLFEFANGGTVFLDEIGELPLGAQAKLLRVLQNQEVQRVGSPIARKVDVRVVAATNRDLRAMVMEKRFRDDLYYRLGMVEITLPRLSERKEDLPLLLRHFLKRFADQYNKEISGVTRRGQTLLTRYNWPGNVRELENVIGSACMLAQGAVIDAVDLPEHIRARAVNDPEDELVTLETVEQRHVLRVLEKMEGNKNRAAEILGISRATLYSILAKIDKKKPSSIPSSEAS
ncbi:MAG TPA: sigma-54 dependent transcriptional regulator [Candidatus Angelobacter sp.]|nr:sigma-54 dependent transcriptional regulator [Candidatus Angelobacter sp.]